MGLCKKKRPHKYGSHDMAKMNGSAIFRYMVKSQFFRLQCPPDKLISLQTLPEDTYYFLWTVLKDMGLKVFRQLSLIVWFQFSFFLKLNWRFPLST